MARKRLVLNPIHQRAGLVVFKQLGSGPLFVNPAHPIGAEWACGHCEVRVLATDAVPTDFWGVAFRCGGCGSLSAPPEAGAGRIAPRGAVLCPPREYAITTVEGKDVALVEEGVWASQRAIREPELVRSRELTPHELRAWEYELRGLLGGDVFTALWQGHQRARSSHTPPRWVHPLTEMIEELRRAELDLNQPHPSIDASLLGALDSSLSVLRRWRRDPAFDSLRGGLVDPREFVHAIVTLTAASYLRDAGNAVYLYEPPGGIRAADLRMDLTPRTFAAAEVKTPERLFRPAATLSSSEARKLLERQARSAGIGLGGQLGPTQPGVLIVGGWHIPEAAFVSLEREAARLLRDRPTWTHLLGVVVAGLGVEVAGAVEHPDGRVTSTAGTSLGGTMRVATLPNPHYAGSVTLSIGSDSRPQGA